MIKRMLPVAALATLLVVSGWALAEGGRPDEKKPAGEPGRFTVAPAGNSAVLLDTLTGRTWVLQPAGEGNAVWIPTRRFDTAKEVFLWQEEEKARKSGARPNLPSPVVSPKVPHVEGLQYQAARLHAALDELDVRLKALEAQQNQFRAERDRLFREREDLEKRIKVEEAGRKILPK
jgi:hypothetical protein